MVQAAERLEVFDVAVVGGGAIGVACALGLVRAGAKTILIGAVDEPRDDGRTAALMEPSVRFLESLGVLEAMLDKSAPLAAMRLIDSTGSLLRAPTVTFRASELDLPYFALNFANADIVRALSAALRAANGVMSAALAVDATCGDDSTVLSLSDGGRVAARLVVAADGQKSRLREAAGIKSRSWGYDQVALTFHVTHSKDHEDISTEIHTRSGPLTFVPFGAFRSSVVWLVTPAEAERLKAGQPQDLVIAAQRRSSSLLGDMKIAGPVGAVPMGGLIAETAVGPRLALAGEALHAFPPIGAQGMNLGLRDCAHLIECVLRATETGRDPGAPEALEPYARGRKTDVSSRTYGVDLLNRTLIADLLPLDVLRVLGLGAAASIPPLRRLMMRAGMGEAPAPLRRLFG